MDEALWYVVHTYSGHENKVKINLEKRIANFNLGELIQEILVPTQDKIEVKEGRRREVKDRIFPGYILVKMVLSDQTQTIVSKTPGVTGFVGASGQPIPLLEKEVEAIRRFSKQKAPKFEASFSVDEAVKIIDGPFADFIGTVESIDENRGKLNVLVNIFGRETPVELDFLQVSKL